MAVLTTPQREETLSEAMQRLTDLTGRVTTLTKPEWRTLLNAADDFMDANAGAYNTSIPVAVRTKATAQEKAMAIMVVIAKRFLVGA